MMRGWPLHVGAYLPRIAGAHNAFTTDQDSYRWSDDDGSETAATYLAAANTQITVGDEAGTDKDFGDVIRLRVLMQETGGDSAGNNVTLQLQVQKNSDGYNNVDGTSSIAQSIASQLVDGNDTTTTRRLGAGTFTTPNAGQDEADGAAGGTSLDPAAGAEWEAEFAIQIIKADVADTDVLTFKVLINGADPDTITNTPQITIDEVPADPAVQWAATATVEGVPIQPVEAVLLR